MNERIKELRNTLNMTQQEFADKLQVKRNTIAMYEMGKLSPSDRMISSMVREYKVNEEWLRTGEGEMFRKQSRDEELAEIFADVLNDKPEDFRRRLVAVLAKLDVEHWHLLEEMAWKLSEIPGKEEKTDS